MIKKDILTFFLIFLVVIFNTFAKADVLLATTTSTENSGLISYLIKHFKKKTGINVLAIATGTGKALKLLAEGNVDISLTHNKKKELSMIANNDSVRKIDIMYNNFIIVGDKSDPANISDCFNIKCVFLRFAKTKSSFLSRGDNSGTYSKEKELWQLINVKPNGNWYKQVGQGMGHTLIMANQLNAYTITDSGTWLKLKNKLSLKLLFKGGKSLFNPYSSMLVNNKKHPNRNYKQAKIFQDWLLNEGEKLIDSYKINGEKLFFIYD